MHRNVDLYGPFHLREEPHCDAIAGREHIESCRTFTLTTAIVVAVFTGSLNFFCCCYLIALPSCANGMREASVSSRGELPASIRKSLRVTVQDLEASHQNF